MIIILLNISTLSKTSPNCHVLPSVVAYCCQHFQSMDPWVQSWPVAHRNGFNRNCEDYKLSESELFSQNNVVYICLNEILMISQQIRRNELKVYD